MITLHASERRVSLQANVGRAPLPTQGKQPLHRDLYFSMGYESEVTTHRYIRVAVLVESDVACKLWEKSSGEALRRFVDLQGK